MTNHHIRQWWKKIVEYHAEGFLKSFLQNIDTILRTPHLIAGNSPVIELEMDDKEIIIVFKMLQGQSISSSPSQ